MGQVALPMLSAFFTAEDSRLVIMVRQHLQPKEL
jgi:hypothetical protein